jgi:D-arabinose 1-dehydrogenase-like Zn-dependent alcohol dehydrogenase
MMKRRHLAGSTIGGIRETQEMLDFCGEKGITADIELIRIQQINEAYERLMLMQKKTNKIAAAVGRSCAFDCYDRRISGTQQ